MVVSAPMVPPPQTQRSSPFLAPLKHFWPVLAVALHILVGTLVWQHLLTTKAGDAITFSDAFYFVVVSFLTIGYGDLAPVTDIGRVCFIVFCITSLVLQLTIVSELVSTTISFRPADAEDLQGGARRASIQTYFKAQPRILKACQGLAALFALITAGAVMLHTTDGADGARLPWLACWYWSITTISTVGYGDIVPSQHRTLFACFFLVTVVLFAYLLGESVALLTEAKRYKRMDKFFAKGLTPEILRTMDLFHDSQVSRVEFLMFVLDRLELVSQAEMERILEMFDEADEQGDGVLNLQDVRNRLGDTVGEGRFGEVDIEWSSSRAIDNAESQTLLRRTNDGMAAPSGA